jgi:ABC-type transport system substrate-binding protein
MATFRSTRGLAVAAVLALGVTSVAACGKNSSGGSASDAKSSKGGTLTVLANEDFAHLDPARNWTMRNQLFGVRLLYRTLTTYAAEPGAKGAEIVPDLAGSLGTPSNGNKTWTYHLRPGLKYEDDTIGDPKKEDDMVLAGWCADWPSGASFIPPIFDGRTITPKGNQVYSQLNDPAVNSKIDQILAMTDAKAAQAAWGQLDTQIVGLLPGVPMVWDRMPLLRGAKVTGAFGHQIWEGEYDYATLGVK